MNDRQLPRRDYLLLKAAFRDLVALAGGPHRAAAKTRGNASLLSRYGAPHEEMFAPDDVVADLESEVGEPIVTRTRAALAGYALVPTCKSTEPTVDFGRHLGAVAKETGQAISELGAAIEDGVVTPGEAARCLTEIEQAEERFACLKDDLRKIAASAPVSIRSRA